MDKILQKDDDYPIIDRVLTIPGGSNILSINSIMEKIEGLFGASHVKKKLGQKQNPPPLNYKGWYEPTGAWIP